MKNKKFILYFLILVLTSIGTLMYMGSKAFMFSIDKCLDNGGMWDKENKKCIGGKYGE
jgi:hypothetical protein